MHRFLIVIENAGSNLSAYSPDLPGCVATGSTREEVERRMYEAIQITDNRVRSCGRKGEAVRCPRNARLQRPGIAVPHDGQPPSGVSR